MIWFQLWREFKLSIAELLVIFPMWEVVYFNKDILILDFKSTLPQPSPSSGMTRGLPLEEREYEKLVLDKAKILWGCIKIITLKDLSFSEEPHPNPLLWEEMGYENFIYEEAIKNEGKFKYWLSIFPEKVNLKKILMDLKKSLRKDKISSRFINKDFKNLSSAQIIGENLVKRWTDFTYIIWEEKSFIWKTIWVQDIKSYSDRDYSKERDMQIGMLPPKLSQIMINISGCNIVYDPFVWLWTILIESLYMWNKEVYWTDLNEKMVKVSNDNISKLKNKFDFNFEISKLNAKFIEESNYLNKSDCIVTEWYLWEVMTKSNISKERILKQRESLTKIYEAFFTWLKKVNFSWNIVICFPFWEIKWKHLYFEEIYPILEKKCNILELLWDKIDLSTTKYGSLLYKRPNQLVWREIFKLTIK